MGITLETEIGLSKGKHIQIEPLCQAMKRTLRIDT
jgi:hypothetical protein